AGPETAPTKPVIGDPALSHERSHVVVQRRVLGPMEPVHRVHDPVRAAVALISADRDVPPLVDASGVSVSVVLVALAGLLAAPAGLAAGRNVKLAQLGERHSRVWSRGHPCVDNAYEQSASACMGLGLVWTAFEGVI